MTGLHPPGLSGPCPPRHHAGRPIRPASFNGIYALKPTHGVVAVPGIRHFSPSLDTIGWYGRSPDDLILVARAFGALRDPR